MGPFKIVERIGPVAYRLELANELHPFHDILHVSQLRKVVRNPVLIVSQPPEDLDSGLSTRGKPIQVTRFPDEKIRRKGVPMVEVVWERVGIREATKEHASMMRVEYPELFETQVDEHMADADSRTNSS
uniref:Tf2-1-like SH3-like domain-containing protein n=1 Tax=Brassica oleracea var. oleracea TaxID=109376 RepID=A0A0D3CYG3_BRAOL